MVNKLASFINGIIYVLLYSQIDFTKANIKIEDIKAIDFEIIKTLKSEYGIGGIVLDVDSTIKRPLKKIPDCNKRWIKSIKNEFKIIFVSNGNSELVKKFAKEIEVEYINFAVKPRRQVFLYACKKIGLNPENVLVIGNSRIFDIFGGNRSGTRTAKVKRICKKEISER